MVLCYSSGCTTSTVTVGSLRVTPRPVSATNRTEEYRVVFISRFPLICDPQRAQSWRSRYVNNRRRVHHRCPAPSTLLYVSQASRRLVASFHVPETRWHRYDFRRSSFGGWTAANASLHPGRFIFCFVL